MKWIIPDYLPRFACRAGACRHTCCAGWEIDIDPETFEIYRQTRGALGEELRRSIREEDGTASFIPVGEEERCPFLNREGLCRIILEQGPDALCQICADHPRFRNFFSDREEMGVGLCCESAAELILSRRERTEFILDYEDDDREELTEAEEALLSFRQGLLDIARDRALPLNARIVRIAGSAGLTDRDIRTPDAAFLAELDLMDRSWLAPLSASGERSADLPADGDLSLSFEQLLVYLLWRHLPAAAEDGDVQGRVRFCLSNWHLIRDLYLAGPRTPEALWDLCRVWSAEIEYSDENPQKWNSGSVCSD